MLTYTYHINLDERGTFYADVRDPDGKTVFGIRSEEDGSINLCDDGFMANRDDIIGLEKYLKEIGTIPLEATLKKA